MKYLIANSIVEMMKQFTKKGKALIQKPHLVKKTLLDYQSIQFLPKDLLTFRPRNAVNLSLPGINSF